MKNTILKSLAVVGVAAACLIGGLAKADAQIYLESGARAGFAFNNVSNADFLKTNLNVLTNGSGTTLFTVLVGTNGFEIPIRARTPIGVWASYAGAAAGAGTSNVFFNFGTSWSGNNSNYSTVASNLTRIAPLAGTTNQIAYFRFDAGDLPDPAKFMRLYSIQTQATNSGGLYVSNVWWRALPPSGQ